MKYRVQHSTTYTYDAEVTGSYGQFHLRPRDLRLAAVPVPRDRRRPGAGGPLPARRSVRQHQVLLPCHRAAHPSWW